MRRGPRSAHPARRRGGSSDLVEHADASLLDMVDHLLNKGVVVTGDVMLGLAAVDLVYLRVSALLCAADLVAPRAARRR
jgi:hypothetical protein